ncbi:MAG TPA: creatininase family protein [Capillimicrobium sp.]|nr:creatininase family protein [Capillimicrobium sp.]
MSAAPTFDPRPRRAAWATSPQAAEPPGAIVLPTGAVEQHGPHLPLGVDAWLAHAVALGAAARDGRATVAEPLAYGCSSHHLAFPGTVSLSPSTFIAVVADVCASLARDGAPVLILNGHGGNRAALDVALAELGERGVRVAAVSYFDLIREDLPELADDDVGHACALETSLMLHLWPESVRSDAIPEEPTAPSWPDPHLWAPRRVSVWRPFDEIDARGVIGAPAKATAELGARAFDAAVERCAAAIAALSPTT